jgi:signal transduction histidine kinase
MNQWDRGIMKISNARDSSDGIGDEYWRGLESAGLSYALVTALQDIFSAATPTEVFPITAQRLHTLLDAESASITLREDDGFRIVAAAALYIDPRTDIIAADIHVPEDSLTTRIVCEGKPIFWSQRPGHKINWLTTKHYVGVPVLDERKEVQGAFVIGFTDDAQLNQQTVLLAQVLAESFWRAYRNSLTWSASFLQGQVIEQERVAQQLHDSIAQNVFGACMKLDQLIDDPTLSNPAQKNLETIKDLLMEIRNDLHTIIYDAPQLRGQETSLATLIDSELAEHKAHGGIPVTVFLDPAPTLESAVMAAIRAIVRESLSNVRKHAQAHHAAVICTIQNRTLTLTIQDDGIGISHAHEASENRGFHFGLANLRRIVGQLGGSFSYGAVDEDADKNVGAVIRTQIPLDAAEVYPDVATNKTSTRTKGVS